MAIKMVIVIVLLIYILTFVYEYFLGGLFFGFVDFPCVAALDKDGCIVESVDVKPEEIKQAAFAIYLSSYEAGWAGAGCLRQIAKESEGEVLNVRGYTFENRGEKLVINENIFLEKGQSWRHTGTPIIHSLITVEVPAIFVENAGLVRCVKDRNGVMTEIEPFVLAHGSVGTYFDWNIAGIAFFFLLLSLLILLLIKERKVNNSA
ncbi:MAG: hypothetical protein N3F05_03115 [Candidatus Diapherotrites archaeon]|nr:hypothetical protein [Candidatus Diapherotrites archaeon]